MDYDKIALNQSGIYSIVNLVNDRTYIGKTYVSFRRRWGFHRRSLERQKHENAELQADWLRHGSGAFDFRILETISVDRRGLMLHREWYHLRQIEKPYNAVIPSLSVRNGSNATEDNETMNIQCRLKTLLNEINIERIRANRPLISLKQFAVEIGISYPTLKGLVDGTARVISFKTVGYLCRALSCTPGDILIYTPDENS